MNKLVLSRLGRIYKDAIHTSFCFFWYSATFLRLRSPAICSSDSMPTRSWKGSWRGTPEDPTAPSVSRSVKIWGYRSGSPAYHSSINDHARFSIYKSVNRTLELPAIEREKDWFIFIIFRQQRCPQLARGTLGRSHDLLAPTYLSIFELSSYS